MSLTLEDLLDLPVVAAARPQVLSGAAGLHREVRWVHTSEIFDIASLLQGGEVLLTTGLGLVAAGPAQLEEYVDRLADRSVAALMLEVGRTFPTVPEALLVRARARELPVVALHGVVPFVEVTETVHRLLVDAEVAELRRAEHITQALTEVLLAGGGLGPLVRRVGELAGSWARLVASDGRVVVQHDAPGAGTAGPRWPVTVLGSTWGHLEVGRPEETDPREGHRSPAGAGGDSRTLLRRASAAVALELSRGLARTSAVAARRQLVLDLVQGRFASSAELSSRAVAVGLSPGPREQLLGVCASVERPVTAATVDAADAAARDVFGWSFVAGSDSELMLVGRAGDVSDPALRELVGQLGEALGRQLQAVDGGQVRALACGPPVLDAPALVGAFATAREVGALARRLGGRRGVLLPVDLGAQRLLARVVGDAELELFVEEQLGPLLEHDARRGQELVTTLDAYLEHGLSKAQTARALGIRRQTVYARIARIEAAVGDVSRRDRRTSLELALVAWRLRTSASNRT